MHLAKACHRLLASTATGRHGPTLRGGGGHRTAWSQCTKSLLAGTTTYLSGTCADRNAAQVPAAAEQRSSLPSFEARRPLPARINSKQCKQKHTAAVATKKQHRAPRFPQTLTLNPKGCAKKTQASSRLRTAPFDSSMRARSGQIHGQSASLNYCVKHDTAEGFPRCTQSALL